jgi:diacylglycerol kinase family enzyme
MRERLDGGVLGIAFVRVNTAAEAEKLAALEAVGRARQFASWNDWTANEFEVRSAVPVEIGVDGEALTLQPPLHFVIRPRALILRLPRSAVRPSQSARVAPTMAMPTLLALWQTVLGRPIGTA